MKSINKDVKFLFIEQYTESDLELDVSIKTDDIFWVKFYAGHKYRSSLFGHFRRFMIWCSGLSVDNHQNNVPYYAGPSKREHHLI